MYEFNEELMYKLDDTEQELQVKQLAELLTGGQRCGTVAVLVSLLLPLITYHDYTVAGKCNDVKELTLRRG